MSTPTPTIVSCVPVEVDPQFPMRAQYSRYEKIKCPCCNRSMWIGERGKELLDHGATAMCMICVLMAATMRGINPEDMKIEMLVDEKAGHA